MNLEDIIFTDNLPTIDLHGFDKDYARIKINEFINDNKKMKNSVVVIIHGRGLGILKRETESTLRSNKDVLDYRLFYNNTGMTLVKIKIDK
jgi:DNA-nicking Smr family endonuclease